MTIEQQKKMLSTERLILSRKRLFEHYEVLFYMGLPMCLLLIAYFYLQIPDGFKNIISAKLILLALPAMGIAIFLNQYFGLRFAKVTTTLTQEENYELAKKTIGELRWKIRVDNKGFLEAFNPFSDFRTWGNEMISILITDHQILINSICNVDDVQSQAALSFGKNRQNINRFRNMFASIEHKTNP